MLNISDSTVLSGFEGMNLNHIQHMLNANMNVTIKYNYFGKIVSRGTIYGLHTKYGILTIRFKERNGWAETLENIK